MGLTGEKQINVDEFAEGRLRARQDFVAIEEPMEIRVVYGPEEKRTGKSLAVTMRTPGQDFELAAGFLLSEGVVQSSGDISSIEYCGPTEAGKTHPNTVRVYLKPGKEVDYQSLQRHFYTTSSCGVCGKASLDAIAHQGVRPIDTATSMRLPADRVLAMPKRLRSVQRVFERTGGIHAAGMIDESGELVSVREDVGRHNAMDKLIGHQLLTDEPGSGARGVVVSGRASFELLQKALVFRAEVFISVGAPSSLAVELAERNNMTLIGFASESRFNIYCGADRIQV